MHTRDTTRQCFNICSFGAQWLLNDSSLSEAFMKLSDLKYSKDALIKFAQWLRKLIVLTTESRALLTTHTQPKIKDHLKKSSIYRGYVITIHSQLKKRSKFGELWNRRKGHSEYYSSNKKGHSIWTFYSIAPITSENYQLFTFRFGFGELSGQGEYTPFCWNEVSQ